MICTIEHQRHLLAKSGGTAKAKLLRAKEEHARELIRQEIANGHATSDSEVAENLLGKGGFKYGKLATLARDELRKKRSS